ncbi:MAG TPA: winged helix-turn-helix domain-containing protein, partial [Candidatus Dormibacteraeota bacterium]|nr:winged helix-turn-helix domain-containing protein [Candidatus Dormibacteraeota bacterium]
MSNTRQVFQKVMHNGPPAAAVPPRLQVAQANGLQPPIAHGAYRAAAQTSAAHPAAGHPAGAHPSATHLSRAYQGWNMNAEFTTPQAAPFENDLGISALNYPSRYACFGEFCLDLQKRELCKDGTRVKMQGKVCDVLMILMEKPGEVVTREVLRMRLWPPDTRVNYDANVNTTVNKLRQVLGDSCEQSTFVETIPRKGYSFIGAVEFKEIAPVVPRTPGRQFGMAPRAE